MSAGRPRQRRHRRILWPRATHCFTLPPACFACHSVAPGVNLAGPSLAGLEARAASVIASPDYKGGAKNAAEFIRESIVKPSAHLFPGSMYSANGVSFMPSSVATDLTPEQTDSLVAYLQSIK